MIMVCHLPPICPSFVSIYTIRLDPMGLFGIPGCGLNKCTSMYQYFICIWLELFYCRPSCVATFTRGFFPNSGFMNFNCATTVQPQTSISLDVEVGTVSDHKLHILVHFTVFSVHACLSLFSTIPLPSGIPCHSIPLW